jgi:nucleoside-diphosphate-sugar epimerase
MAKYLLTGAAGFIASRVAEQLLAESIPKFHYST